MASLLKIFSVSPRTSLSSSSSTTTVHSRPPLAPFFPPSFTRRRIAIRAAGNQVDEPNQQTKTGSSFNQLLGIKGAAQETNKCKVRLQLTKPVTWPPLIWGVACGAAASGNFHWDFEDVAKSIVCMMMSGPFLMGYTQTMNDWYDREIDAINEPYRPIPSGAISENEVIAQIWFLLLGGLTLAGILDIWAGHASPTIFDLALGGSLVSYIYSAPPFKFGVGIVNDFKSVEGDRAHGLQSIPVAFGAETAKWISVGAIDITQLLIVGYLLGAGKPYHALALLLLTVPQVIFQFQYFLKDPEKYDVKYQASAQPFLVLGMLVTALASCH
ncbi:hypothetical protein AAHE18_04G141400 [Arachis hypogaea]